MRILILVLLMTQVPSTAQEDLLTYKRGACYGKCPVFNIEVSNEGLLTFEGRRFVKKEGTVTRKLSKKEFRKLKRKLKRAKFHTLEDQYGMNITDVSMTTIKYTGSKGSKQIKSKMNMPKKLKKLEQYLLSLTPQNEEVAYAWQEVETEEMSPTSSPTRPSSPVGRKELAQQTLIVELKASTNFDEWLKKYDKYGVRLNKKIVPNRPLFLLRHDPKTIQITALLKQIKQDTDVVEAQLNKKTTNRARH